MAQQLYEEAIERVDRSLKPLSMQLMVFNALAKYQEHHLRHLDLDYIPLPSFKFPKETLVALVDPATLATQALQIMGKDLCPAPPSCNGMLLPPDVSQSLLQMEEVESCGKHFVATMTSDLAEALMQNVTLEPVAMTTLSLLELAE